MLLYLRVGSGAKAAGDRRWKCSTPTCRDGWRLLVEPLTSGDPESPLRWKSKSTRVLAVETRSPGPSGQLGMRRWQAVAATNGPTAFKATARPTRGAATS